jgi:ankyrin repeat protein
LARDEAGQTALHYACADGDVRSARALVERQPELLEMPDEEMVSQGGLAGVLLRGARACVKADAWWHLSCQAYPLHVCAATGQTEVVALLLEKGARPDVKDAAGWVGGVGRV